MAKTAPNPLNFIPRYDVVKAKLDELEREVAGLRILASVSSIVDSVRDNPKLIDMCQEPLHRLEKTLLSDDSHKHASQLKYKIIDNSKTTG